MSFLPSQYILIGAILLLGLYAFRARTKRNDRIILVVLACGGIVLVISPELSTRLANQIGIGRGTDLILYLFIVITLFRFVGISADMRNTDRQITQLVREEALSNAQSGADPHENPSEEAGSSGSDV